MVVMDSDSDSTAAQGEEHAASDTVEQVPATGAFRTEFDAHSRPPSKAVIHAEAVATDSDPLEVPPLYSAVDPDALNDLLARTQNGQLRGTGAVTFEFNGHRIAVESHGVVEAVPADAA